MLTDGFSPWLVQQGHTRTALDLLIENTSFRIRILTKNAAVGSKSWVRYFADHWFSRFGMVSGEKNISAGSSAG